MLENARLRREQFDERELAAAAAAVAAETATVRAAMGHADKPGEEYAEAWAAVAGEFIFLPAQLLAGDGRVPGFPVGQAIFLQGSCTCSARA